jgi:Domain of unknown function (DUF4331)
MKHWLRRRDRLAPMIGAAVVAAAAVTAGTLMASDHQDTPFVEFNQRYDVNDVYAFPASTPGRMVLVLSTASPVTPARTPTFTFENEREALYQIKVDNTGDAVEDLVFQMTFNGAPTRQEVTLRGPMKPTQVGTANMLLPGAPTLRGGVNRVLGSSSGVQLFAGPRDDPFFLDLEQFFRIIPDRKPESGPLSKLPSTPTASSFRPKGEAVDYLRGFNDMAIVIELPISMLVADPSNPSRFGVWGTTSRAR